MKLMLTIKLQHKMHGSLRLLGLATLHVLLLATNMHVHNVTLSPSSLQALRTSFFSHCKMLLAKSLHLPKKPGLGVYSRHARASLLLLKVTKAACYTHKGVK